jgi:hypothetical protein
MPHARALLVTAADRWAAGLACGLMSMACAVAGCSTMGLENSAAWATAKREPQQAVRMTIAWTHSSEKLLGKPELRGFRARVRFYDAPEKKDGSKAGAARTPSIKVDGTITVYAFDETLGAKWGTSKSRKFVVTPAQLRKQHVEIGRGHEYELWFPWDKVGGAPLQIRFLVRFDPAKVGPVLVSENSRYRLPSDPSHSDELPAEVEGGPAPSGTAGAPGEAARN